MGGLLAWLDREGNARDPLWHFPAEASDWRLSDLRARSGGMAAGLAARGVRAGDRVVTLLDNGSAAVSLLLALWQLGAVPVPLRPWYGNAGEVDGFLRFVMEVTRRSGARLVVAGGAAKAPMPELERLMTTVDALQTFPVAGAPVRCPDAVPNSPSGRVSTDGDGLALIQYSSGSTGQPRGVIVTHAMVMAQLRQLADNYASAGSGVPPRSVASWLPFYHDMGLFIGVLLPLFAGANVMVAPPVWYMRNPARWFAAMAERGSDLTFSTSSVLAATLRGVQRLHGRLHGRDCDLSALVLYVAAEKISPAVLDEVTAVLGPLGFAPAQLRTGYGMAEYTLGCTHTRENGVRRLSVRLDPGGRIIPGGGAGAVELVSVGRPNEGCAVIVRDEAGQPLDELTLGEVTVAGPCLTPGYWDDAAATRQALGQGWLRTGDLGFLHQGELFFVARKDEMLTVGGRNVIPADVEQAVESLPFVGPGRAVLFGADNHADTMARQVLLVEGSAGSPPPVLSGRLTAIRNCILDTFGFVPTDIAVVPKGTIEKTSSGKKRTAVIRRRWQSGFITQLA